MSKCECGHDHLSEFGRLAECPTIGCPCESYRPISDEAMVERAKAFVASRGDGTPDEMELYVYLAADFALSETAALRKQTSELLQDVMNVHSDPDSGGYNYCDDDPCQWCINAKSVLADLSFTSGHCVWTEESNDYPRSACDPTAI